MDEEEKPSYDDYIEEDESRKDEPQIDRNYIANVYEAQKWYSNPEGRNKFPELILKDINLSNLDPTKVKLIMIWNDLYYSFMDLASIYGYEVIKESADFILQKIDMLCATSSGLNGFERQMSVKQITEQTKFFRSEREIGEKKKGFSLPFFNFGRKKRYQGGGGY